MRPVLVCDLSIAANYKSPAQRARVMSEHWFARNCYCLACETDRLLPAVANTKAMDFSCNNCGHQYELKTFVKRPTKSLVDGAYAALMSRIQSNSAPTLCLLERNDGWQIRGLTAIHSSFITAWVVERRKPLGENARRAGWVGCNIRLDRIPPDGEIAVIDAGICRTKSEVRRQFKRFLPLADLSPDQRGWTTLTLTIIRNLGKPVFSLGDLYERERQFSVAYPANRHVRPKIRQQLQVLRDLGVVSFEGSGVYVLVT